MSTTLSKSSLTDPILAAFDNPVMATFAHVGMSYNGWTYVSDVDADNGARRIHHYAVRGKEIAVVDFTPFQEMTKQVFVWLVDMGSPQRHALDAPTSLNYTALSPLSPRDVERLMLWAHYEDTKHDDC